MVIDVSDKLAEKLANILVYMDKGERIIRVRSLLKQGLPLSQIEKAMEVLNEHRRRSSGVSS